jgi:hypothetical protein
MKKQKEYLRLTLLISVLVGIIFPLSILRSPIQWNRFFFIMVLSFTSVWFICALARFITVFLIKPSLKIKGSRRNGVTVVKLELIRKVSE